MIRMRGSESSVDHARMSTLVSVVLVTGVGLSAVVIMLGLIVMGIDGQFAGVTTAGITPASLRTGIAPTPETLGDVWAGLWKLNPKSLIQLGILMLIATPIARVAVSAVLFALERDHLYTVVTLVVLTLLLTSVFLLH